MTCTHVLGLIDAGPFADHPRAHLDAAWQHARKCPTCGRALDKSMALPAHLRALAQPQPPSDLARAVMARIARIDERRPMASSAGQESVWPTGALAVTLAIVVVIASGGTGALTPVATRGLATGVLAMPAMTAGVWVLAAGLILYLAGLFAPLARRRLR